MILPGLLERSKFLLLLLIIIPLTDYKTNMTFQQQFIIVYTELVDAWCHLPIQVPQPPSRSQSLRITVHTGLNSFTM